MLINEAINTILQVLVFTLIPFIVYLITHRKVKGFFHWIGLYGSTRKANLMALGVSLVFLAGGMGLAFINESFREVLFDPHTVTGKIRAMGFSTTSVIILLMIAGMKTSLSEEIFFRGFVAKRLMSWLGFRWGNLAQAFIFGLLHFVLFYFIAGDSWGFLFFILFLSGLAGYLIGIIKEKYGKGSIVPGWIAHGLGNTLAYTVVAFLM